MGPPEKISESWDGSQRENQSSNYPDVVKIETDFRNVCLSPEKPPHHGPTSSLSWVWQEVSPTSCQNQNIVSSPGVVKEVVGTENLICSQSEKAPAKISPEDMFGPVHHRRGFP